MFLFSPSSPFSDRRWRWRFKKIKKNYDPIPALVKQASQKAREVQDLHGNLEVGLRLANELIYRGDPSQRDLIREMSTFPGSYVF